MPLWQALDVAEEARQLRKQQSRVKVFQQPLYVCWEPEAAAEGGVRRMRWALKRSTGVYWGRRC